MSNALIHRSENQNIVSNSEKVRISLKRAFKFLQESQGHGGMWSDFLTLAGESVFWVSGYVGYAISCDEKTKRSPWLNRVGATLISNQDEKGGWGYCPGVPPDADSTSWCVRFLSRIEMLSPEISSKAIGSLLNHQNADGGFRTYENPDRVGRFMGVNKSVTFEGWCDSQVCVTAAATQTLFENKVFSAAKKGLHFIENNQNEEGFWEPYWWNERLYATYHCIEALRTTYGDNSEPINRSQNWIARNQHLDGSWGDHSMNEGVPFSTALALRGLKVGQNGQFSEIIENGIEWLLTHQREDGSWGPDYILRIPHPAVTKPWIQANWIRDGKAINAVIKDQKHLFSTATVFSALHEYTKAHSRGKSN